MNAELEQQIAFPKRQRLGRREVAQLEKRSSQNAKDLGKIIDITQPENQSAYKTIIQNPFSAASQDIIQARLAKSSPISFEGRNPTQTAILGIRREFDVIREFIAADLSSEYDKELQIFRDEDTQVYTSAREKIRRLLAREIFTSTHMVMGLRKYCDTHWQEMLTQSPEELYTHLTHSAFGTTDINTINRSYSQKQRLGFRLAILNAIQDISEVKEIAKTFEGLTGVQKIKRLYDKDIPEDAKVEIQLSLFGYVVTVSPEIYKLLYTGNLERSLGRHESVYYQLDRTSSSYTSLISLRQQEKTEDMDETRLHEIEHAFYEHFGDIPAYTETEKVKTDLREAKSLTDHLRHARNIERFAAWDMYHELTAQFAQHPSKGQISLLSWEMLHNRDRDPKDALKEVSDFLSTQPLSTVEKKTIFNYYLRAYQKHVLSYLQLPLALKIFLLQSNQEKQKIQNLPPPEEASSFEEFRALFLSTDSGKIARVLDLADYKPSQVYQAAGIAYSNTFREFGELVDTIAPLSKEQQNEKIKENGSLVVTVLDMAQFLVNHDTLLIFLHAIQSLHNPAYFSSLIDGIGRLVDLQWPTTLPGSTKPYSPQPSLSSGQLAQIKQVLCGVIERQDDGSETLAYAKERAQNALDRMGTIEGLLQSA